MHIYGQGIQVRDRVFRMDTDVFCRFRSRDPGFQTIENAQVQAALEQPGLDGGGDHIEEAAVIPAGNSV